jgi:hypothetical protein
LGFGEIHANLALAFVTGGFEHFPNLKLYPSRNRPLPCLTVVAETQNGIERGTRHRSCGEVGAALKIFETGFGSAANWPPVGSNFSSYGAKAASGHAPQGKWGQLKSSF